MVDCLLCPHIKNHVCGTGRHLHERLVYSRQSGPHECRRLDIIKSDD